FYQVDFTRLPEAILEDLNEQSPGLQAEFVRGYMFGAYPVKVDPLDEALSQRQKDFYTRMREDFFYHVETYPVNFKGRRIRRSDRDATDPFHPREGQAAISLATTALQCAFNHAFDIGVFLIGDRDYKPAIRAVRRFGKRTVILSIRNCCTPEFSAVQERAMVADFDTLWMDDMVPRIQLTRELRRHEEYDGETAAYSESRPPAPSYTQRQRQFEEIEQERQRALEEGAEVHGAIKTIKQKGTMTFQQIADFLQINLGVIDDILRELRDRKMVADLKPLHYDLTDEGRRICYEMEKEDAYVGPAPVSYKDYCEMVLKQSKRAHRVSEEEVIEAFAGYALRPELVKTLKEGYNSQKSLFFYGPAGNGKTLVTGGLHRLMDREPTVLPYAFEFNGRVVRYYDPAYHTVWQEQMDKEMDEATPKQLDPYKREVYLQPDHRWLICHAPLVVVGTEFRVEHFEIAFDGVYDAPPQVKANNGVFIFDDLGRQAQDHNLILNQFIYPLESQESIVKFGGGSSMRAPYKQRLFLSTNLNKDDIIDDAFKRRLLYQVLVDRPTIPLWRKIFHLEAKKVGCQDTDRIDHFLDLVLQWWERDRRVLRACDPRNIFVMLDATLMPGETIDGDVSDTTFERIYWQFPAGFQRDAVAYTDEANQERIRKLAQWEVDGVGAPPDWDEIFHKDPAPAWDGNPPETAPRADLGVAKPGAKAKPGGH
ncbi:MAG: NYN domain-containing protein, partial [Armatimonadetes bacterium]|nr:NYN domain-containing protein [Armatimonadota bacterium]